MWKPGRASDRLAFAKLPPQFGFAIEYTDNAASLRYYEPDFVAVLADGSHLVRECLGADASEVVLPEGAAGGVREVGAECVS